eukprot:TRINITY_DN5428_c0_g1_i2.p1 TRINITY_DN5428_c0_g1~~TRINITY_DN5428_c0_g1_i2.p1  ORF type:complete len:236 (+),score=48.29 TRINITY_DN5428_c0_g1_i2:47-754(+)
MKIDISLIHQKNIMGIPSVIWKLIFNHFDFDEREHLIKLKRSCKLFYKIIRTDQHLNSLCQFFSFNDFENSAFQITFSNNNKTLEGKKDVNITKFNVVSKTKISKGTHVWFIRADKIVTAIEGNMVGVLHESVKHNIGNSSAYFKSPFSFGMFMSSGNKSNNGNYNHNLFERISNKPVIDEGEKVGVKVEFGENGKATLSFFARGEWRVAFTDIDGPLVPVISIHQESILTLLQY